MKPNAHEFSGIKPLPGNIPEADESYSYQIDLLADHESDVNVYDLPVNSLVEARFVNHRDGSEQSLCMRLLEHSDEPSVASVETMSVTGIPRLAQGDVVQFSGSVAGGSLLKLGTVKLGSRLEFVQTVFKPMVGEDFDGLNDTAIQTLLGIGYVKRDEAGGYLMKHFRRIVSGFVVDVVVRPADEQ